MSGPIQVWRVSPVWSWYRRFFPGRRGRRVRRGRVREEGKGEGGGEGGGRRGRKM